MKLTSTIIAVIFALLGVAAMHYTVRHDSGGAGIVTGPRHLLSATDLPVDQIDRITLKRAGGEEVVFQRSGAEWNQTQPLNYPMDPFSMRQMAIAASELQVIDRLPRESLAADQTLATLQLTPPAAEITYQWPGGSLTLQLGRRTLGGRAYLRRAGDDAVYLVNQKLHERALDMNAAQWREKRIFLHAGIDSDRIAWVQSTVKLTLERDRKSWNMTEPEKTRVDRENLDAYLQALGRANVADFILDVKDQKELANFGLAEPVAALTVVTRVPASPALAPPVSAPPASTGGANVTPSTQATQSSANTITERLLIGSQIGAATNDRFAMIEGRPVVVRLSEAVIGALFRMPDNLAAPTGSGVNPADVKSIVIRMTESSVTAPAAPGAGGGGELRLERDLETWHAPQHNNAVVNAAAVQELLDQLCKLRAPNIEFRLYPGDLEIAKVTLYGFDGKALDTVRIAQQKDKPGTALENGDNVLRVFPQGLKLRLKASDYGL